MIVLIGASASGKTEVAKTLIAKKGFSKIVTYTTREIRPSEVNGVDYHFVTKEKFLELKNDNFFLETTTYNNNFYGTPRAYVEENVSENSPEPENAETKEIIESHEQEKQPEKQTATAPKKRKPRKTTAKKEL